VTVKLDEEGDEEVRERESTGDDADHGEQRHVTTARDAACHVGTTDDAALTDTALTGTAPAGTAPSTAD